jgi:hypothetical protein
MPHRSDSFSAPLGGCKVKPKKVPVLRNARYERLARLLASEPAPESVGLKLSAGMDAPAGSLPLKSWCWRVHEFPRITLIPGPRASIVSMVRFYTLPICKFDACKPRQGEPIVGNFSQETLAEMIGTTRSRVSFFMNKFRKLGFIEYNGKLEVHNSLLNVVLHDTPEIKTRDETIGTE